MELDLSLGDTPKPGGCMERHGEERALSKVSGLSMGLSLCQSADSTEDDEVEEEEEEEEEEEFTKQQNESERNENLSVELDLLPHAPVLHIDNNHAGYHISLHSSENKEICETCPAGEFSGIAKGIPALIAADEAKDGATSSNSAGSSFQVEICRQMDRSKGNNSRRNNWRNQDKLDGETANVSSKSVERKLRLSKEQSTFLEQSFKEHYTLNPKQKIHLAKQLNLRPRQVEVWFQNRRARTKLKQTELDFHCLKRWCEALKEENRRLEKEVQELRAAPKSLYFRLPPAIGRATATGATAASICPLCRRISEPDSNTNTRMNMSKTMSFLF